jgi:hypothetical protein
MRELKVGRIGGPHLRIADKSTKKVKYFQDKIGC